MGGSTVPVRALEFFAGIGGLALGAAQAGITVVRSWEQDRLAAEVYRHFHGRSPERRNICGLRLDEVKAPPGTGWLLSPPCQPYTAKGKGRDCDDPRAAPLNHLTRLLPAARPAFLFLENVPPFASSRSRLLLLEALAAAGLQPIEAVVCPTALGFPNRRPRYYLLAWSPTVTSGQRDSASERQLGRFELPPLPRRPLSAFLLPGQGDELTVVPDELARLDLSRDVVEADDPEAITGVFGSSYGRALHGSGSYVRQAGGRVRRFSPDEILRLLGFPERLSFPSELPRGSGYRLAGNSVNVAVVGSLLALLAMPLDSPAGPN